MNNLQLSCLISFCALPFLLFSQCLNGIYTFGGNDPDFDSFFQLQQRLVIDGVCGPVEILLRDGTYSENLSLQNIQGTSASNTLTIRSESGNPTDVTLNAPVNNTTSGVIVLNFMQYVTLQDLSLRPSDNSGSLELAVNIRNASHHITLRNLHLQGFSANSPGSDGYSLVSGNQVSDILIESCSFKQAETGISGSTFFQNNGNWTIRNNQLEDLRFAISLNAMDGLQIEDNFIQGDLASPQSDNAFQIQGTNISLQGNTVITDGAGISINGTGGAINIANNMIAIFPPENTQFSYNNIFGADQAIIDHNTIVIANHNTIFPTSALNVIATEDLSIRNNIFVNQGSEGFACNYNSLPASRLIDHNIYFAADEIIRLGFSQAYPFADWQLTELQDNNSRVILPDFVSTSDLHLNPDANINQFLDATGTPVPTVTKDIDGETRNATSPDIGADEFNSNVAAVDIAVVSASIMDVSCDGVYPLTITVQNNSDSLVTYMEIDWTVNNNPAPTLPYEVPLAPGAAATISLDSIYLAQNSTYDFVFTARFPNGASDSNPDDNTLTESITISPKPLPNLTTTPPLCPQVSTTLSLTNSYSNYNWSTEATTASIEASAGTYSVTVTDSNGCTGSNSFWIQENDIVSRAPWITNGLVHDIEVWEDQLFIGGEFSVTTPFQPGIGAINSSTLSYESFPSIQVGNTVHAIISDGQGGYFVGGDFSIIGGKPRQNLAHIDAGGEVSNWRANVNGLVYALLLDNDQLFIGGDFSVVNGRARHAVAAVNPTYGHTLDWEASIFQSGQIVRTLNKYEDYLVAGGNFFMDDPLFSTYNLLFLDMANGNFPIINNNLPTFYLPVFISIR
ncbi:MAG: hypothetical protein AAGJ93_00545 [Bacteroidota bacterium]